MKHDRLVAGEGGALVHHVRKVGSHQVCPPFLSSREERKGGQTWWDPTFLTWCTRAPPSPATSLSCFILASPGIGGRGPGGHALANHCLASMMSHLHKN